MKKTNKKTLGIHHEGHEDKKICFDKKQISICGYPGSSVAK